MQPFSYEVSGGRVVFGPASRQGLPEVLDGIGATRVLVVVDPAKVELERELGALVGDRIVARFDEIVQHVPVAVAEKARELARDVGADCVLTLGGGSATGFGKAIRIDVDAKFVAVPTTFAGSEMTTIWGLSEGGQKKTGRNPRVKPDVVVYDPELVVGIPREVAGPSGMNALAHCVEALYGPGANPVTAIVAREGAQAIVASLASACSSPEDVGAVGDVLYGACLAGIVLDSAGTALHHKACHVLGGMFDLNHGDMNAVLLPHALAYSAPAIIPVVDSLAKDFGVDDPAASLFDLGTAIGAPRSLEEIGMPFDGIGAAAEQITEEAAANPRPPDVASIRVMLEDAYSGRRPSLAGSTS